MAQKTSSSSGLFSKDPAMILMVLANAAASLSAAVLVLIRLRSNDFKVPGQYIALGGEVELTQWYTLYSLAIFAVLSFFIGVFLAKKLYSKSPAFAKAVLGCQLIIGVTNFFVANALLSLVSRL